MSNAKYDVNTVSSITGADLPDPQKLHKPSGANIKLQKVGVKDLHIPVKILQKNGEILSCKGTFSVYCSLSEGVKGLNMSRIPTVLQEYALSQVLTIGEMFKMLESLKQKLETDDAYIKMRYDMPMIQYSLGSTDSVGNKNFGYAYYPVEIEVKNINNVCRTYITTEYYYSSACPCSWTMCEEMRQESNGEIKGISHNQKSTMRTTIEIPHNSTFTPEDLIFLHRSAITTEVLSAITKRQDEFLFAHANFKQQLFVEDASRVIYETLENCEDIKDFVSVAHHDESLHPHMVVGIVYKGIVGGLR